MSLLTVLIPVYKPGEKFGELLDRIYDQTVVPDRVLLLWTIPSDSDENAEKEYSKKYKNRNTDIVYIMQKDFDHGGTRKYGMSLVDTDYAVCMTQDAVPADNKLFEELINAFNSNSYDNSCEENDKIKIAAVYARQLPRENAAPVERITRDFNYPDKIRIQNKSTIGQYGIKAYFCSDVCAMYKLEYYRQTGGFVDKTIFNEDMIMAASLIGLGYTVIYAPDAIVIHSHHYTYRQQYKRNFDNAVSHRQYAEVFDSVPPEGEGIRLVKETMKRLVKMGKIYMLPDLVIQSAFKYLGYRSGMKYDKMSYKKIMKKTMNRGYFDYMLKPDNDMK